MTVHPEESIIKFSTNNGVFLENVVELENFDEWYIVFELNGKGSCIIEIL